MADTLRSGSLQIWPRKRAGRFIPSVNWKAINSDKKILGFIAYKVGMKSAYVKDLTADSISKDKNIVIPVTILEAPPVKIFSVRFYKNNKVISEMMNENLDKELKRVVKLSKKGGKFEDYKDYDDIRILVYSEAKKTDIKKTPDMAEIALGGSLEDKKKFVVEHLAKEILLSEFVSTNDLIDIRGLTKGKGLSGPVKRFGITLRFHKSEKGQRNHGSLGPWHPRRVTYMVPIAGQLGLFTRIGYNQKVISVGKISEQNINPKAGWTNFGNIKTDYLILRGSVQGPCKRQILLTAGLRKTKYQDKKKFNFIELR